MPLDRLDCGVLQRDGAECAPRSSFAGILAYTVKNDFQHQFRVTRTLGADHLTQLTTKRAFQLFIALSFRHTHFAIGRSRRVFQSSLQEFSCSVRRLDVRKQSMSLD